MTAGIAAITVDGSADEVRQLVSWLGAEDELAGRVRLAGPGPSKSWTSTAAAVMT